MSETNHNSELLLQAHRYFTDEMPATERAEFETQLSSSLAAQDALADVVLIHQGLQLSEGKTSIASSQSSAVSNLCTVSSDQPAHARRSIVRIAALLTTSLALLVVVGIGVRDQASSSNSTLQNVAEVDSEGQSKDLEAMALWTLMSTDEHLPAESNDEANATHAAVELDVPDWMFAAVEASSLEDDLDFMNHGEDGETL
ncbi:hypothetical protein [Thalassoglobus polymorphus]|uniref:Zinc-finger domain-containing protein n=1 Tax=Thalassoglobus polymorphus TaxID=2527994 RepID=A0A517QS12_9PLAN|nr:hypothetical protein [Thalassoglobus polymorphus]QDT34399.1 hypothetical protein Mal48_36590 [Thalassoglobus polymorphus]